MRGFAALPVIVIIVVVLGAFLVGGTFLKQSQDKTQNKNPEYQTSSDGYGYRKAFWEKDGISLQHYWPGEENFSNEETEILIFNDSNVSIQVKSFSLDYSVEGKVYPHKSGTWEKYPNKIAWEKLEYLNISPSYYQSQPLALARGEKGKLHWHIQFGPTPLDGKQTVHVKLTLLKDSQTFNIDEKFQRDQGEVFSKDEH